MLSLVDRDIVPKVRWEKLLGHILFVFVATLKPQLHDASTLRLSSLANVEFLLFVIYICSNKLENISSSLLTR